MRRFPFETGAQILALGDVFRQDLDGERAVKPGVAGFIDLAHAKGSNRRISGRVYRLLIAAFARFRKAVKS